ncbi:MAG: tripartite tricarboxylate transporter TctB family protein [Acetobacteraceae bacterium]
MLRAAGSLACGVAFGALLLATLGLDGSLHYPLAYSQVLIAGIAVLFVFSAVRDRRDALALGAAHPDAVTVDAPGGVAATLASAALCVAYALAWPWLGFFLATFLYVAAQLWLLRERSALFLLGVPGCVTLLVYVVFARLLALPFPAGAW